MNLSEAKFVVAKLMIEKDRLWKKSRGKHRSHADSRAYHLAEHDEDQALSIFAADPELRKHMDMWLVAFNGQMDTSKLSYISDSNVEMISESEIDEAIHATGSELAREVRKWIESKGFSIPESGSGFGGWDLGVLCNDEESIRLCTMARIDFADHIESGVLKVALDFWGFRFKCFGLEEAVSLLAN